MGDVYEIERRPRKRRGRGFLATLLIFLIVVGVLLAVGDRVAHAYAERQISDRVAQQLAAQKATSEKPDVTIEGFPFLTQVVSGRYHEIKIGLADFAGPAGNGKTIRLPRLDVLAQDVRAPLSAIRSGNGDIVATSVTGTGTVAYPEIAQLVGQPGLKLTEKDGKLVGSAPVQVLGQNVELTGTATLTVRDGVVQMRFADVTAAGVPDVPLVKNLIDGYVQKLAVDMRVPQLPLNLKVQSVEPRPDGLRVTAGAREVSLNSGGL